MNRKKAGVMAVVFLSLLIVPIGGTGEFEITTNRSKQYHPKIYGNVVVWHDYRNGNLNIYGYNLSTKEGFQITEDENDQFFPAIYENTVVWYDRREGNNCYIYGYNLLTKEEFPITEARLEIDEIYKNSEPYLAIYGDIVVWEDYRNNNWDIYGYDLSTKREFQVTRDTSDQFHVALYGDIVVWGDQRNGNWDIYSYDISKDELLQLTSNSEDQQHPAIYGNIVVWEDKRHGNWDIYGCDLLTDELFSITTDPGDQVHPAIYGDCVVWEDRRNGSEGESYVYIYSYNFVTQEKILVTPNMGVHIRPEIYEDIVVWWDYRNGNPDIFGYCIMNRDRDGDGYTGCNGDCDDSDPHIYPGAQESCGKDNNCDKLVETCTGDLEISVIGFIGQGLRAQVYIDGSYRGITDTTGNRLISDLEADMKHSIRIEAQRYETEEETVLIEKNTTKIVRIQMRISRVLLLFIVSAFCVLAATFTLFRFKRKSKRSNPKPSQPKLLPIQIHCPHCGNKIEKTRDSCPHCGSDLKDYTKIYDESTRTY